MTVETKYNIGQKVWGIINNKVQEVEIINIHIHSYPNKCIIRYGIGMFETIDEENVFPTKEELLKSF